MIVHGGNVSNITDQIRSGFANGAWNGSGIESSAAAMAPATMALGVELNSDGSSANGGLGDPLTTSFDGLSVTETDVLVKYTYFGDANLDGVVSAADYQAIDNGFNLGLSGWDNGDFNYDGMINGDDYALIDNAFNTQGSVSFAGDSAGPTEMIGSDTEQVASSVPEPGSMVLMGLAVPLVARRRRRDG
jgi:hypothetical protein